MDPDISDLLFPEEIWNLKIVQKCRCDIAWLHVTKEIIYTTGFRVKRLNNLTLRVRLFTKYKLIINIIRYK
jgi:hypothetical protein